MPKSIGIGTEDLDGVAVATPAVDDLGHLVPVLALLQALQGLLAHKMSLMPHAVVDEDDDKRHLRSFVEYVLMRCCLLKALVRHEDEYLNVPASEIWCAVPPIP